MSFKLDDIFPWGRSFYEYQNMFSLVEHDLGNSILDVASGPSSFNAEFTRRGGSVISVDPIYQFDADAIRQRISASSECVLTQLQKISKIMYGQPSLALMRSHKYA